MFLITSLFGLTEQMTRYDQSLNLRSSFVYLINLGVAHQLLYRVFRIVTRAAKNLRKKVVKHVKCK